MFTGNAAVEDGGAIWVKSSDLTVFQSLIADNTTGQGGGGVYVTGTGTTEISWSTIVNNTADSTQFDLLVDSLDTTLSTRNSIIIKWFAVNASHSNLIDLSSEFLFADNSYHLASGSRAIDASGVTSGEPERDLDGNLREGNGTAYDCGAYEYGASPASMPYADAADAAFSSLGEDDLAVDFDRF